MQEGGVCPLSGGDPSPHSPATLSFNCKFASEQFCFVQCFSHTNNPKDNDTAFENIGSRSESLTILRMEVQMVWSCCNDRSSQSAVIKAANTAMHMPYIWDAISAGPQDGCPQTDCVQCTMYCQCSRHMLKIPAMRCCDGRPSLSASKQKARASVIFWIRLKVLSEEKDLCKALNQACCVQWKTRHTNGYLGRGAQRCCKMLWKNVGLMSWWPAGTPWQMLPKEKEG